MVLGGNFSRTVAAALAVATIPLLAACGGGNDNDNAVQDSVESFSIGDDASFGSPDGASSPAANVDVCSLLSQQDASSVAENSGLAGGKAAGATYAITATKVEYDPAVQEYSPRSGCRFAFEATTSGSTDFVGAVAIETTPAEDFDLYASNGKPISGIGDEAVDSAGTTYVKVGDVMLQAGENSFTGDFVTELFRKMAPNLK